MLPWLPKTLTTWHCPFVFKFKTTRGNYQASSSHHTTSSYCLTKHLHPNPITSNLHIALPSIFIPPHRLFILPYQTSSSQLHHINSLYCLTKHLHPNPTPPLYIALPNIFIPTPHHLFILPYQTSSSQPHTTSLYWLTKHLYPNHLFILTYQTSSSQPHHINSLYWLTKHLHPNPTSTLHIDLPNIFIPTPTDQLFICK